MKERLQCKIASYTACCIKLCFDADKIRLSFKHSKLAIVYLEKLKET